VPTDTTRSVPCFPLHLVQVVAWFAGGRGSAGGAGPAYWITVETIAMALPLPAVILPDSNEGEAVELEVGQL
jgi:hypothetical protein